MNELSCEDVLMAQMAAADGEEPAFSKEQLAAHVTGCAGCQNELKQLLALDRVLASHALAEHHVDLWPTIENRIAKPVLGWRPFALIGLLLIVYKLLEMLPAHDLGIAFKLVPLVIVILLFVFIKENPFRINTELVMER
ncbi:MAG: hypothetical protein V7638_1308 [Acidobacteriota bacterium]|jgi:hypothetical protein